MKGFGSDQTVYQRMWSDNKMVIDEEDFENTKVATAAIAYYLYRLAGYPMGNSFNGFTAWLDINVLKPFEELGNNELNHEQGTTVSTDPRNP